MILQNQPQKHYLAVPTGILLSLFGLTVLLVGQISPGSLAPLPGIESCSPITALYLLLAGCALMAPILPGHTGIARHHIIIGGLLCLVTLASMAGLFTPEGPFIVDTPPPINSSLAFFLCGLLLIMGNLASTTYAISALFLLFVLIWAITLLGLVGLTLGFDPIFGWSRHVHMTAYSVTGLFLFTIALAHTIWQRVRTLHIDPVHGISAVTGMLVVFIAFAGGIVIYTIAGANIYQVAKQELHQQIHERTERLFLEQELAMTKLQLLSERLAVTPLSDDILGIALANNPDGYVEVWDASTGNGTRLGKLPSGSMEQLSQVSPGLSLLRDNGNKYYLRLKTMRGERKFIAAYPLSLAPEINDDISSTLTYENRLCPETEALSTACSDENNRDNQFAHRIPGHTHIHVGTESANHLGKYSDLSRGKLLKASIHLPELKLKLIITRDIHNIFDPLYRKMLYGIPLILLLFIAGVSFATWRITPLVRAIQKSEQRFRLLAENANDLISRHDITGNFLYTSPSCQHLLGYKPEELAQHNIYELIHPDDQDTLIPEHPLTTIRNKPYRIRRKDNHYIWFETTCTLTTAEDGIRIEFIAISRDISERYKMEQALKNSERHNRSVVEVLGEGIVVHDRNGVIISSNKAAQDILGRNDETTNGLTPHDPEWAAIHEDLSPFPGESLPPMLALSSGQSQRDVIMGVMRPDGKRVWISVNAEPVWDDKHQEVVSVVTSFIDITEQRQAEKELRESREQLRALTTHLQEVREQEKEMIAREVHDELGSTMTALKLGMSWLENRLDRAEPLIHEKLTSMTTLLDQAVITVRRLLTRLRPTILDDLGLWAALEWKLREFSHYAMIQVSDNLHTQEVEVSRGKALAIYRVLQEALTNVAKHAKAGKVHLDCWSRAGILHITLEDDGVGLSETTAVSPTSHGLRGMYERIASVGGRLDILSTPGEGTVITIEVPLDGEMEQP